jgi:hypothetical protein
VTANRRKSVCPSLDSQHEKYLIAIIGFIAIVAFAFFGAAS